MAITDDKYGEIYWIKYAQKLNFVVVTEPDKKGLCGYIMLKFSDEQIILKALKHEETELFVSALQTVIINCRFA